MSGEAVKVIVRCRPMNEREKRLNSEVVVAMDPSIVQVQLRKPKSGNTPPKMFTFDGVYFTEDHTQQIYEEICFPLVSGVLEGFNGTVFAYGQTGCGKSFTMMGVEYPPVNQGIIPRAFGHIFDHVAVNKSIKYLVRASYLEIYNEEVRDLLGKDTKKKLDLHENPDAGVYVQGLSHHKVHNVKDLEQVMNMGSKNRSVGATLMNVDSSRSHSIFSIDLEMLMEEDGNNLRAGRLNLVDLAGSERQSKTGSTGDRLKEATKINLSLSALGNVISALVDGKSKHIPYRDSKLTRLLQSSLGGNTKTLMVACISPADNNYDETLSTLRYANRAKNIKNKPKINEDPKDALLREYQEEIEKLKKMLMGQVEVPTDLRGQGAPAASTPPSSEPAVPSEEQLKSWQMEKEAIKKDYEKRLNKLEKKFGKEKANKEELQVELNKLKEDRDQQLSEAETKLHSEAATEPEKHVAPEPENTSAPNEPQTPPTPTAPVPAQLPQEPAENLPSIKAPSKAVNTKILKDHQKAMQRLEELQGSLIGGEKAADETLKKQLKKRQRVAEERKIQLEKTTALFDDDENVLERVFNSLTDEVRVKTKIIEKTKDKVLSLEDDIVDLSAEFEGDREDYLSTIREQDKKIKLCEQLLSTVVPCLRRDCNYFNIDKIIVDCVWKEDSDQWELPKLVVTKTELVQTTGLPKGMLLDKRSKESPPNSKKQSISSTELGHRDSLNSLRRAVGQGHPYSSDNLEDDRYRSHLQRKSDETMEYFKPKRALELIGQSGKEGPLPHDAPVNKSDSLSSLPNAAAVHGIDPILNDMGYSRRPGKLQSLANNPPMPPAPSEPADILEKMEKKMATKKNLEPLADIKTKRLSH